MLRHRFLLLLVFVVAVYSDNLQRHLALTETPTSLVISWITHEEPESQPCVFLATREEGAYSKASCGATTHYYKSYHHNVRVNDLAEGKTYWYKVGIGGKLSSSSELAIPSRGGAFTVAVFGDMGITNSEDTIKRLYERRKEVDFYYHVGDIGYADDRGLVGENPEYESIYNQWAESIESFTKEKAYMVCPGNHDITCHTYGRVPIVGECPPQLNNYSAYLNRFRMPFDSSNASTNLWFSFNYKNVHFVSVNTESDYKGSPGLLFETYGGFGDQMGWLKGDLSSVDRTVTPWVVVVGHRPLYATESLEHDFPRGQRLKVQKAFEGIFHDFGVDLYLAGHVHDYERHWPVYQNKVISKQYKELSVPTHIVVGCAGNTEGHSELIPNIPEYVSVRNNEDYGFGELIVHNDSVLEWTFIAASSNLVKDRFFLSKSRNVGLTGAATPLVES